MMYLLARFKHRGREHTIPMEVVREGTAYVYLNLYPPGGATTSVAITRLDLQLNMSVRNVFECSEVAFTAWRDRNRRSR